MSLDIQKKTLGYAISSNSLLERLVEMSEENYRVTTKVEAAVTGTLSISQRIADSLDTQTSILLEIRDLLKDPTKTVKSSGGKGGDIKKLGNAGGVVALMGLGLVTFIGAFMMAGKVGTREIASAIGVAIAMIPISKAFANVIEEMPTSIVSSPVMMMKMMLALSVMAFGYLAIAVAIRATPTLEPKKLLNAIAVSGVFFIVGSVFAKLLEAMTNRGLFGFFMNRNRVQQTMGSMVIMAMSLVVIGIAITAMPMITMAKAGAFAIASLALIPLAIAFKQLKFVFVLSRKFKVKDVAKTAVMMGIVAMAMVPLGYAASLIPPIDPSVAASLFGIGMAMIPVAFIVQLIGNAISGKSVMNRVLGPGAPKEKKEKKMPTPMDVIKWSGVAVVAVGALAVIGLILAKAAPSIIKGLNAIRPLDMMAMGKLIITLLGIGLVVGMVVNLMRGKGSSSSSGGFLGIIGGSKKSKQGKISLNDMIVGALAMPVLALGLVATAYIFQMLPGEFKTPPIEWTLGSAAAVLLFSIPFFAVSKMVANVGIKNAAMGMLGMAVISLSILAVAYALSLLPNTYTPIPIAWSLSVAIALTIFAIPVTIIGLIATSGVGGVGILLGAVGMIVIAATMLAVAWILSYIPADKLANVAKGLTDGLLAPVNGIVDVLARLKNEIGVENLVPLAGGIIAISGSLIALAAATAGVAIAGLGSQFAEVGSSMLSWVTGTEKPDGPIQILEKLLASHAKLQSTANAMKPLSESFKSLIDLSTVDNIEKLRDMSQAPYYGYFHVEAMKEYPKFLDNVAKGFVAIKTAQSGMDIQIIDKTTEMFKALAYLSEVGGDNAMAKLGDNLILAVKELANMIANFDETVKEQGQESAASTNGITSAISSLVSKISPFTSSGDKQSVTAQSDFDADEIVDVLQRVLRQMQTGIKTIPA